jgi:hypothetical protein
VLIEEGKVDNHHRTPASRRKALGSILVLLALLHGAVLVSAEPPPTWTPPVVYKYANKASLGMHSRVQFTVMLINPRQVDEPNVPVTWTQVHVTDVISSALKIDTVNIQGTYDSINVVGNTVVASVATLEPGDWLAFAVSCTVIHPGEPGSTITNVATVDYQDENGDPAVPFQSNVVTLTMMERTFLPITLRQYGP